MQLPVVHCALCRYGSRAAKSNCKSFGEKVRFISLRSTTYLHELWMYPKSVAVEVMR